VSGRALAFSDAEIIRMATNDYIAVAADDWYQRRRQDAEGAFFISVANQGPRKGEGGSTRQGIYCFTADGKLLAYKNAGQNPEVMRDTLRLGLREWKKLPEDRRKPGAIKVEDLPKTDAAYSRKPPTNGLIVKVFTRILDRKDGEFCQGTCKTLGGDKASRDHLWLTEAEWKSLVPANPTKGDRAALPAKIAERICRFHLIDNTRGEPPMWRREDIRKQDLSLTIEEVTPTTVRLRLEGPVLLASQADAAKADRGFDVQLLGHIEYDAAKKAIARFDVAAVGDHWGEGTYTRNARPGRQPLGVAFELADPKKAADLVPPQAAREVSGYFGR
jgi:hypothetical protein